MEFLISRKKKNHLLVNQCLRVDLSQPKFDCHTFARISVKSKQSKFINKNFLFLLELSTTETKAWQANWHKFSSAHHYNFFVVMNRNQIVSRADDFTKFLP